MYDKIYSHILPLYQSLIYIDTMSDIPIPTLAQLREEAELIGILVTDIPAFVKQQQAFYRDEREANRDERAKEREERAKEREAKAAADLAEQQILNQKLQLAQLNASQPVPAGNSSLPGLQSPTIKFPIFQAGDDIINFITRFEKIALMLKLSKSNWPVHLGSVLTG